MEIFYEKDKCLSCGIIFDDKIKHHAKGLCRSCYDSLPEFRTKRRYWKKANREKQNGYVEKHMDNIMKEVRCQRYMVEKLGGKK